jgi:ATP-dependent Clp protease ATP-binding subunit ClpA
MGGLGFKEERKEEMLSEEEIKERVFSLLREQFKPEFLNRVDEIIIFHPLSKDVLEKIVELQLETVIVRLTEKNIKLTVSPAAKNYLTAKGYDPIFGARPLKRVIQNEILDELALKIIEGGIKEGDKVKIDFEKEKIIFK